MHLFHLRERRKRNNLLRGCEQRELLNVGVVVAERIRKAHANIDGAIGLAQLRLRQAEQTRR